MYIGKTRAARGLEDKSNLVVALMAGLLLSDGMPNTVASHFWEVNG